MLKTFFPVPVFALVVACSPTREVKVDTVATATTTSTSTSQWAVRPDSFGVVPLGVPFGQASAALDHSISIPVADDNSCHMVRSPSMPRGTSLMALREAAGQPVRIERVDVDSAGVLTAEGVGVGDSEASVMERYRDRVQVMPHKYTGPTGHYLVVASRSDTSFRMVFETDGQHVTKYRAGRRPAVDFVERCG